MTEYMTFAPIIVPTLCRNEHFVRCISSLSKCAGAEETDLFIGVDYPTKESHWPGYRAICNYCKTITGFKTVNVFYREENYGQLRNTRDIRERIRAAGYETYILTEDDNEFSPNYIMYMNQALDKYRDDPQVLAVCAYPHPDRLLPKKEYYPYNVYCMRAYCAWGAGNWFKKQDEYSKFPQAKDIIYSYRMVFRLFANNKYTTVHRLLFRYENASGDIRRSAYCTLENKFCIFPMVPKVRNWGFDGSGHNCAVNDSYARRALDEAADFSFDEIEIGRCKAIDKMYNAYYGGSLPLKITGILEYLYFRVTGKNLRDFKAIKKTMAHRAAKLNN